MAGDYLQALGEHALRYVKDGQTIGLGTGRAASAFIRALSSSGLKVRGVPTSNESAELARAVGIELAGLEAAKIDADFDGADEVDPRLALLKGFGGALVREKIVAAAARRFIVLVGEEKLVTRLGKRGRLPVEVVPFGAAPAARAIAALGLKTAVRKRADGGADFITDNGNLILDCAVREIRSPARLDRELRAIAGVVGTGLFTAMADLVLVASPGGKIRALKRRR